MNVFNLVLRAAQESGILPITSVCNTACMFCSHQSNPKELLAHYLAPLSIQQVEDILSIMPVHENITIGESVTTIMEGEPFTHPHLREILILIRARFPNSRLSITTNGTKLSQEWFRFLARLKPITLQISLNCISAHWRRIIMPGTTGQMPEILRHLQEYGIPFTGSLVAMPHIVGWQEVENTISYLDQVGAEIVRIFLPGYTRYSPSKIFVPDWVWPALEKKVQEWRQFYSVPITLEPTRITDLRAEIAGVVEHSAAARAGFHSGDEILLVDGCKPRSRVEAFEAVKKSKNPECLRLSNSEENLVCLEKNEGERSGLVMDYDLSLQEMDTLQHIANTYGDERALVLTSPLAFKRLQVYLNSINADNLMLKEVQSYFFGGNIMNAGLLTVEDYCHAIREATTNAGNIVVPHCSFDERGFDLSGGHYSELNVYGRITIL